MPGTLTNNGSISIVGDTEELAGAVDGAGSFSLSNSRTANLVFNSSVSAGQIIGETGAAALTLNEAQSFAATISGFGTGDTIDATNFLETATSHSFLENSMGTGGTLTLTDTSQSLTAKIHADRRLFELEFHPRPRQRDRHPGEIRLSRPLAHSAIGSNRSVPSPRAARRETGVLSDALCGEKVRMRG